MKLGKYVTDPREIGMKQLWRSRNITLSLGAFDQSRQFGRPSSADDPYCLGYLHNEVGGPLLPVTLFLRPEYERDFEDGQIGSGHISVHSEQGHISYNVNVADPKREIGETLNRAFLHAAVGRNRWVQVRLHKPELSEAEWLAPWAEHACSATHKISSIYVSAQAKLPDAPTELFNWLITGEIPTR